MNILTPENCPDLRDIRLIATDLDETLLLPDKSLSQRTLRALSAVLKLGIYVVPASGRPFPALPPAILGMPDLRYAVTSNGVVLNAFPDGRPVRSSTLAEESVRRLMDVLPEDTVMEATIDGRTQIDSRVYDDPAAAGMDEAGTLYIKSTRSPCANMRGMILEAGSRIEAIDLLLPHPGDQGRLRELIRQAAPEIYVTSSHPHLLELSSATGGKSRALRWLEEILGIEPSNVLAFGDSENDCEMLRHAGTGIAMGNSSPQVREAADYVTHRNTEDGVAHVLEMLLSQRRISL